METPTRKVILDLSTISEDHDVYLGDFGSAQALSVQCSWSGLDATDGWVTQIMTEEKTLNWVVLEDIKVDMNAADGAGIIINENYVCKFAGVRVHVGSCTAGAVTIVVTSKK